MYLACYESKESIKSLINQRMLDISNTAADLINGDDLKTLKAEDKGTKKYNDIYNDLKVFRDNIDLEYIYAIADKGNKKFVFILDTDEKEPGAFGSSIVYTDALYKASKGKAAVDDRAYKDEWGSFYSTQPATDLAGKRILLAEDMSINAQIISMILAMQQIEVECAEDGQQAVDKFSEKPEWYYDAILMDIRMPVMNGLEATAAIRDMDRSDAVNIPIIALTANAFSEDVQRSIQAGMNAHLSKPVEPDELFETLESFFKVTKS